MIVSRTTSLPSRKCGLKSVFIREHSIGHPVTSFAEVWIEIACTTVRSLYSSVTSFAEVWIEIRDRIQPWGNHGVTSFAEVWIEIRRATILVSHGNVTSFAEVWIEIVNIRIKTILCISHFLRGSVD